MKVQKFVNDFIEKKITNTKIAPDAVSEYIKKELEKFNNTVRVHITSAIEINEERKNEIKNKIEEKFNKNIIIDIKD